MSKLIQHFENFALLALEKEDKLTRLVGEHFFDLDLEAGFARFGSDLAFPCQVLGTQSDNTLSWLWAWSEAQEDIPLGLIRAALEMRDWGLREGVPEASEPAVDLDRADGRMLAMIATEVCKASCFYRDPYDGGALFLLLSGSVIDGQPSLDAQRLALHLQTLSLEHEINPRQALLSYFGTKGISVDDRGTAVTCRLESGETFLMAFDDQGRILDQQ